jgi:peptidoglycan/xylan/chitin deacetylase (PgdA/CDA1 family)
MHSQDATKSMLAIVMYHYVRDLPRTQFPGIKGLLTEKFEGQLDYISSHYSVCKLTDVVAASRGEYELPPNACVLTFDDGLADHYQTVFPRLLDRGFTGAFFPPSRPVEEHCVLDVHKIQFLLAATTNPNELMQELLHQIDEYRGQFTIASESELRRQFALPSRFDTGDVVFIKRMLQWVLPEQVRSEITNQLFQKYVSRDQTAFAQELYMDVPQMRQLHSAGMEIGGHGYSHLWLGQLSRDDQSEEIRRTFSFLSTLLERRPSKWAMCYPFGSYNSETLGLLAEMDCAIGLTTKMGLANLSQPLELDRFDTNDLPISAGSNSREWAGTVG